MRAPISSPDAVRGLSPSIATIWRPSAPLLALVLAVLVVTPVAFRDGVVAMWRWWLDRPEYSHGVFMPLIALFLLWQQRDKLERSPLVGSWWGVAVVVCGSALLVLGTFGSALALTQYAYVLTLGGLMLSLVGLGSLRVIAVPFAVLVLMVPLPEFIFRNLTAGLQLVSSQLGASFIRLLGGSVYLEGNVIDLGNYKLEVAEACSGLRYLFPLMVMGFLMAYFYKAAMWKRATVMLSTLPITVLMNSLRIGLIGLMVSQWGGAMAEGFLHDFEGWFIFMASVAVLILEVIVLSRVGKDQRPWRSIFGVELPASTPAGTPRASWKPTPPFVTSCALVAVLAVATLALPERRDTVPERSSFIGFPSSLDQWTVGHRGAIEQVYLDVLKLDDYIMTDYERAGVPPVQLYVAWYDSQRAGLSAHSPRTCIPGGGWTIDSMDQYTVPGVTVGAQPLRVNRILISNHDQRELVYYWFQQRGRVMTNEYLVKWYMFVDSILRNRTDGAMVRLVIPVTQAFPVESGQRDLDAFVRSIESRLGAYIPQ